MLQEVKCRVTMTVEQFQRSLGRVGSSCNNGHLAYAQEERTFWMCSGRRRKCILTRLQIASRLRRDRSESVRITKGVPPAPSQHT